MSTVSVTRSSISAAGGPLRLSEIDGEEKYIHEVMAKELFVELPDEIRRITIGSFNDGDGADMDGQCVPMETSNDTVAARERRRSQSDWTRKGRFWTQPLE